MVHLGKNAQIISFAKQHWLSNTSKNRETGLPSFLELLKENFACRQPGVSLIYETRSRLTTCVAAKAFEIEIA